MGCVAGPPNTLTPAEAPAEVSQIRVDLPFRQHTLCLLPCTWLLNKYQHMHTLAACCVLATITRPLYLVSSYFGMNLDILCRDWHSRAWGPLRVGQH